jgi:low affinity Fe/Cu permease
MSFSKLFSHLAETVSHAAGRPVTFALSVAIIVGWATSGPLFGFSDTWQLIINTGTTIITFRNARNTLIGLEHLDDKEVERVRTELERYQKERRVVPERSRRRAVRLRRRIRRKQADR